jgi:preprotein translocase subunit YajC
MQNRREFLLKLFILMIFIALLAGMMFIAIQRTNEEQRDREATIQSIIQTNTHVITLGPAIGTEKAWTPTPSR